MTAFRRSTIVLAGFILLLPARAWAAGEEQLGNEPLSVANYAAWPGLEQVVNGKARLYYNWVNGNENFYYHGSMAELNAALKNFASADLKTHEVVLRPGPGKTQSFQGDHQFTFHWHLQIFGGIAAHLTTRDQGDQVWNKHPRLTIHLGDEVDLAKLEVPKGVTLLDVETLSARARNGIKSTDQSVRGWSAGVLADIDAHSKDNLAAIEKLLTDDKDWVRLNAAGALPLFGAQAKSALPALKACLERPDKGLQERAAESIKTIEAAEPDEAAEQAHAEALAKIKQFIADRP